MRRHLAVFAAVLVLCSAPLAAEPAGEASVDVPAGPPAAQASSPEEKAEMRELLELSHALDVGQLLGKFVVDQMCDALKKARPDLPPRAFDLVADEVNAAIAAEMRVEGGFEDLVGALYRKHFTREEVRSLIAFYKTPVGRKLASKATILGQEGMSVGAKWGERIGPRIGERVQKRLEREGIRL